MYTFPIFDWQLWFFVIILYCIWILSSQIKVIIIIIKTNIVMMYVKMLVWRGPDTNGLTTVKVLFIIEDIKILFWLELLKHEVGRKVVFKKLLDWCIERNSYKYTKYGFWQLISDKQYGQTLCQKYNRN